MAGNISICTLIPRKLLIYIPWFQINSFLAAGPSSDPFTTPVKKKRGRPFKSSKPRRDDTLIKGNVKQIKTERLEAIRRSTMGMGQLLGMQGAEGPRRAS